MLNIVFYAISLNTIPENTLCRDGRSTGITREAVLLRSETMQYLRVFSKKEDDFVRYWASISTEKTDKDGNGTGKYARANMSVRLSSAAAELFKEHAEKTKTKGIKQLNVKATDFWLKATEPKEGDPFVYIFLNKFEIAEKSDEEDD